MDSTDPYDFPYPECDPPVVKDRQDIAHLRDLAIAVDTEVERLYDLANDRVTSPDGALMFSSTSTPYESGDPIDFTTTQFDNTGGAFPNLSGNYFVCRDGQRGFYYFTIMLRALSSTTSRMRAGIRLNGTSVSLGSRGFPAGSGTSTLSCNHEQILKLEAGDRVDFYIDHVVSGTIDINRAFGAGAKVLSL